MSRVLKDSQLFLLLGLCRVVALSIGCNHYRFIVLIRAGACVRKTGLYVDVGFIAKLGEIGAGRRLQALRINRLTYPFRNIFYRRDSRRAMAHHPQDNESWLGSNHAGILARLE